MVDYLDQIDIAMIAPSRAGKSTLICAMKQELQQRLPAEIKFTPNKGDNIWQYWRDVTGTDPGEPESTTFSYAKSIDAEYRESLKFVGKKFKAKIHGSRNSAVLSFDLRNQRTNVGMPFRILDYPGGAIDVDSADLHTNVLEAYAQNCFALVVPVFSLALVESARLDERFKKGNVVANEYRDKNAALMDLLQVDNVVSHIQRWCVARAAEKREGILIFVPVKCESYFGQESSNDLLNLMSKTKGLYFDLLKEKLVAYNPDLLSEIERFVTVHYSPVLTFGESKIGNGMLRWLGGAGKRLLVDTYEKNEVGLSNPTPTGAAWLIHHIIKRRNELLAEDCRKDGESIASALRNQGWLKKWWKDHFGDNDKQREKQNLLASQAEDYEELVKKIAIMKMTGSPAVVGQHDNWPWDF